MGQSLKEEIANFVNKLKSEYVEDPLFTDFVVRLKPFIDKEGGVFVARKKPLTKFDELPPLVLNEISNKLDFKGQQSLYQLRPNSNHTITQTKLRLSELVDIVLKYIGIKYLCSIAVTNSQPISTQFDFWKKRDNLYSMSSTQFFATSPHYRDIEHEYSDLNTLKDEIITKIYNDSHVPNIIANKKIYVQSPENAKVDFISPFFDIPLEEEAYILIGISFFSLKQATENEIQKLLQTIQNLCIELKSNGFINYSKVQQRPYDPDDVDMFPNIPWTETPLVTQKGGNTYGYKLTTFKYKGKDGVSRCVYMKGISQYIKCKCKDGTFKYIRVK